MATSSKVLVRAAAATTSSTLYTVPASTSTVVSNIVVANTASTSATFTLTFNGIAIQSGSVINGNSSAYFDLKQVLNTGNIIAGFASAATVNFHISGVEIS